MQNRTKERILLIIVSFVLVFMAWSYKKNITPVLEATTVAYIGDTATVVNLAYPLEETKLKSILASGDYFSDPDYAGFVVRELRAKLGKYKTIPNLGALNKKNFLVDASEMEKAGRLGRERLRISQYNMGLDSSLLAQESSTTPGKYDSEVSISPTPTGIRFYGKVTTAKDKDKGITEKPIGGVLVVLTEEFTQSYKDSVLNNILDKVSEDSLKSLNLNEVVVQPVYYARTDGHGNYAFNNLQPGKNYSITPVKPGKEYGILSGAASVSPYGFWDKVAQWNPLTNDKYNFNFKEREHKLRLFDNATYQKVKNDRVFTVRSPDVFQKDFTKYIALFLLSFWVFHMVLSFRKSTADNYILPLLLLLSGIGLIILYSIQDPMRDEVFGNQMAIYGSAAILILTILTVLFSPLRLLKILSYDYATALHDKGIKMPPWFSNPGKKSRGYFWLVASIILMIILLLFGWGPEGSGVKVNLGPIQVSEIAKYLMILFFAKYFAANLEYFKKIPDNKWLLKHNLKMLVFFVSLIGLYVVLGDLGPALVVCAVFLVFYSFAKNEFLNMVLTATVYGILLFIIYNILGKELTSIFTILACVGLCFYTFWVKKKDESSFFLVLLISAFSILEIIPLSPFKRLSDRNGMFHNIWENELNGGDQVAQGVWSLASGGWTGQGLGNGSSNVMPAYHTDMIFQSIGEELGLISLVLILVAFGLLLFRSMLAARNTGKAMLFYFMGGVAIATILQLAIIVGGSLGLIPLTGISVPFLSKGNSGLVINMLFFGVVLILSGIKATKNEATYVNKVFDSVNASSILTFIAIILVFCFRLVYLQFNANENMVKPALVLTKQKEWQYSVNPRIKIIGRELKAGNIYDRNGEFLATSDKQEFVKLEQKISAQDSRESELFKKQKYTRQSRYYPYSEDLVYWLGDVNSQLVTSENVGYVAEFRHYSDLRGLNAESTSEERVSRNYQEEKYLPKESDKKTTLVKYDYSAYIPFLKAGKNSTKIKEHNEAAKDRVVSLSLDVDLQRTISGLINTADYKNNLVSVVALKADDGQVLASVSNPKPNYDDLEKLRDFNPKYYNKLMNAYFGYNHYVADRDLSIFKKSMPGSTIKVLDAIASFNRFGLEAPKIKIWVDPEEIIRSDESSMANRFVYLEEALQKSSNVYFIKLMNEKNLHPELFDIYSSVGISLYREGGFFISKPQDYFTKNYYNNWLNKLSVGKGGYNNEKLPRKKRLMQSDYSWISWGQGPIEATPLQMARITGVIANHGVLAPVNFTTQSVSTASVSITKSEYTSLLSTYLTGQTNTTNLRRSQRLDIKGKTGSPERMQIVEYRNNKPVIEKKTDGWYVFYVENTKYGGSPVAFSVRIEGKGGSGNAAELASKILEKLKEKGYFNTLNN